MARVAASQWAATWTAWALALWLGAASTQVAAQTELAAQTEVAAQRVVLLPAAGDVGLEAERAEAHEALRTALAEAGMQVSEHADAACQHMGCASMLLVNLEAPLAAGAAVWRVNDGAQVNVTLVDDAGNRFAGVAPLGPEGAGAATLAALHDAQSLERLGPGPWLRVDGSPAGARVEVDGRFVGTLPYRGPVAAGDHQLAVKARGHAPKEHALAVPLDTSSTVHVDLSLRPEAASQTTVVEAGARSEEAPTDALPGDRASPWNFVLGGAAVAAGLAVALIQPMQALARDGDCVDATCERVYSFGGTSALQLALGTVLAGAGVTLMVLQPLRVDGSRVVLQGEL